MKFSLLLTLAVSLAHAQPGAAPAARRPATAPAPIDKKDRGRLEGIVVNALTGEPLRKATVTARASTSGNDGMQFGSNQDFMNGLQEGPGITVTGQDGKFVIEDVVPGRYTISATRTGFVNSQWGARTPGKLGSPLTVATAQKISDLTIRMTPQGVATGRVLDEDGDPMQGVTVQAVRFVYSQGKRVISQVTNGNTNDLGEFRLPNLPPGRLFLVAGRQNFGPRQSKVKEAYPSIFYPNAPDISSAAPLEVTAGADLRGMDFRMRKIRAFRVGGKLIGMPAGQRSNITLIPRDRGQSGMSFFGINNVQVAPDGSFEIPGVLPGAYEAHANVRGQGGPMLFARQNVDVSNEDVEGLSIALGPGLTVTGMVRVDEGELPAGSRVMVRFHSRDGNNQSNTGIKPDGSFSFGGGMTPGLYTADIASMPDGYYLKSIKIADREIGAEGIDLSNTQSATLEFVIAQGAGVITGTAQSKDGKPAVGIPVSIHPKDPALARADREKSTVTDQNGTFTFNSMAPGEYVVFAWDDAEGGAWLHPDFRQPFESDATTVKLSAQGRETIQSKSIETDKP